MRKLKYLFVITIIIFCVCFAIFLIIMSKSEIRSNSYPNNVKNRKYDIYSRSELRATESVPIIDSHECDSNQNVSIFISSVPLIDGEFHERRRLLRKSWVRQARQMYGIDVYFVMGKNRNQTIDKLVKEESQQFTDIIQFDFVDDYRNQTLKTISTLRWIKRKCSNVKVVLKTHDNVVINLDNLLSNLTIIKSGITGHQMHMKINAFEGRPEIIQKLNYNNRPVPYVHSSAYLLTTDVIDQLITTIDNHSDTIFNDEDFFITGIIPNLSQISVYNSHGFAFPLECNVRYVCQMSSFIAITDCLSAEQLFDFWYEWKYSSTNCSYDFLTVASLICVIYVLILISYRISFEKINNLYVNYNKNANY